MATPSSAHGATTGRATRLARRAGVGVNSGGRRGVPEEEAQRMGGVFLGALPGSDVAKGSQHPSAEDHVAYSGGGGQGQDGHDHAERNPRA